jgi:hypothetical protein
MLKEAISKWVRMSSYLKFDKQKTPKGRKTAIYSVWTEGKDYDDRDPQYVDELGQIKWYPAWRRYVFFPSENTLYDANCLEEIEKFLRELMASR